MNVEKEMYQPAIMNMKLINHQEAKVIPNAFSVLGSRT